MSNGQQRVIPWAPIIAALTLLAGSGLTVGGVYVLAGAGWALLAAAAPLILVSAAIFRGLARGK